ncbi:hypothetical protein [Halalkalibacter krulwichiae]|uniref:Uncharacterized protein n=1 Tax=Halalkalibacter krulwichiae TaxID=199441 RepID=A0A1X9M9S2_9BACI|nr:hypothetical protein [Halalkalibacter krulwichiae]ARK30158.1 hypothetical protein BkAM31D_09975 [Halalkalibacter krulwichiae]
MNLYKKLPPELLIHFYQSLMNTIKKGNLKKNTFYELGMIISVAAQRGIQLAD